MVEEALFFRVMTCKDLQGILFQKRKGCRSFGNWKDGTLAARLGYHTLIKEKLSHHVSDFFYVMSDIIRPNSSISFEIQKLFLLHEPHYIAQALLEYAFCQNRTQDCIWCLETLVQYNMPTAFPTTFQRVICQAFRNAMESDHITVVKRIDQQFHTLLPNDWYCVENLIYLLPRVLDYVLNTYHPSVRSFYSVYEYEYKKARLAGDVYTMIYLLKINPKIHVTFPDRICSLSTTLSLMYPEETKELEFLLNDEFEPIVLCGQKIRMDFIFSEKARLDYFYEFHLAKLDLFRFATACIACKYGKKLQQVLHLLPHTETRRLFTEPNIAIDVDIIQCVCEHVRVKLYDPDIITMFSDMRVRNTQLTLEFVQWYESHPSWNDSREITLSNLWSWCTVSYLSCQLDPRIFEYLVTQGRHPDLLWIKLVASFRSCDYVPLVMIHRIPTPIALDITQFWCLDPAIANYQLNELSVPITFNQLSHTIARDKEPFAFYQYLCEHNPEYQEEPWTVIRRLEMTTRCPWHTSLRLRAHYNPSDKYLGYENLDMGTFLWHNQQHVIMDLIIPLWKQHGHSITTNDLHTLMKICSDSDIRERLFVEFDEMAHLCTTMDWMRIVMDGHLNIAHAILQKNKSLQFTDMDILSLLTIGARSIVNYLICNGFVRTAYQQNPLAFTETDTFIPHTTAELQKHMNLCHYARGVFFWQSICPHFPLNHQPVHIPLPTRYMNYLRTHHEAFEIFVSPLLQDIKSVY